METILKNKVIKYVIGAVFFTIIVTLEMSERIIMGVIGVLSDSAERVKNMMIPEKEKVEKIHPYKEGMLTESDIIDKYGERRK